MTKKQLLFFLPLCVAVFMAAGMVAGSVAIARHQSSPAIAYAQGDQITSDNCTYTGSDVVCYDSVSYGGWVCDQTDYYACDTGGGSTGSTSPTPTCTPTCGAQCGEEQTCGGVGTGVTCGSATNSWCVTQKCNDGVTPAPNNDPNQCVYCSDGSVAPNMDATQCICGFNCGQVSCGTYLQCGQTFNCGTCPPPPPPTCSAGTHLEGSTCVPNTFSCDQVSCGTYLQNGQFYDCGPCITSCPTGQHLVGNTCVDNPVTCPNPSSQNIGCDPGYTGTLIENTTYGPAPACAPNITYQDNCVASGSTISVTNNTSGSWSINGQSGSGSSSITVDSGGGTLYTITPASVAGYDYPPTVTNSVTGSGSSMMLFGGQNGSFTLTYRTGFDYSLSNSGSVSVIKGGIDTFGQATVTKTLTSGTAQAVSLALSGVPAGVQTSMSGGGSCAPNCTTTITFTVSPSAAAGTYPITVTGNSPTRTTTFNLVIQNAPGISVACAASPNPAMVGQSVTWTGTVSGGVPPYTYTWTGTNVPTSPAPTTNPFAITYSTVGAKSVTLQVRDSIANTGTCNPSGNVQVNFNPNFQEF